MPYGELEVIVLAAGQGSRMRSSLPKVLHELAGRPLLDHVLAAARALQPKCIHLVVGHGADRVREVFTAPDVTFHQQAAQLGTGHAVRCALPGCANTSMVLVLFGDVPLITPGSLQKLVSAATANPAMLATECGDPTGYGRVVTDESGGFVAVVEEKDASDDQRRITRVNTGVLAMAAEQLDRLLAKVGNDNAQGEYYLPDVLALARDEGLPVNVVQTQDVVEAQGVNDRIQLERLERVYQERIAESLLASGVAVQDRQRIDVRGELSCGEDALIDVNTVFEGRVVLADGVRVGANCVLRDVEVGPNTDIQPFCHIEGATIGAGCRLGPYARLRPGTVLDEAARVGNFVETKNTHLGEGSKANHLAYLGDAQIGSGSNIGAGTITCNYDGVHKHPTILGDGVFVGSNATLVAPLSLADESFVAAGSVLTEGVEAGALAVGRARQRNISGWRRPGNEEG